MGVAPTTAREGDTTNNGSLSTSKMNDKSGCAYSTSITPKEYFEKYQSEMMATESFSIMFQKVMQNLLPQIGKKQSILDIGTGPAAFVVHYGKLFDKIVTIEPNPHFCSTYNNKHEKIKFESSLLKKWTNIASILQDIDISKNVTLSPYCNKNNGFSMVSCIHAWYYIHPSEYAENLHKIWQLLSDNNGMFIVSMTPDMVTLTDEATDKNSKNKNEQECKDDEKTNENNIDKCKDIDNSKKDKYSEYNDPNYQKNTNTHWYKMLNLVLNECCNDNKNTNNDNNNNNENENNNTVDAMTEKMDKLDLKQNDDNNIDWYKDFRPLAWIVDCFENKIYGNDQYDYQSKYDLYIESYYEYFDSFYPNLDNGNLDDIIWRLLEELSFAKKDIDTKLAKQKVESYIRQTCYDKKSNGFIISASVGHLVVHKFKKGMFDVN